MNAQGGKRYVEYDFADASTMMDASHMFGSLR
jgi:hypothetical protein